MGHLINIINKIVELCSNTSLGKYLIDNLPEVAKSLDEFKESTLKETNAIQDTLLVSLFFFLINKQIAFLLTITNCEIFFVRRVVHILILPMKKMMTTVI
jgi:hypothetical protein